MGSVVKLNTAEGAFKALDACHRDIAAHLDRLATLFEHLSAEGVDAHAQQEARAIEAFFSETPQQHHVDEEAKVFPALSPPATRRWSPRCACCSRTTAGSREDWLALAPQLRAIAASYSWYDPAELQHGIEVFPSSAASTSSSRSRSSTRGQGPGREAGAPPCDIDAAALHKGSAVVF